MLKMHLLVSDKDSGGCSILFSVGGKLIACWTRGCYWCLCSCLWSYWGISGLFVWEIFPPGDSFLCTKRFIKAKNLYWTYFSIKYVFLIGWWCILLAWVCGLAVGEESAEVEDCLITCSTKCFTGLLLSWM